MDVRGKGWRQPYTKHARTKLVNKYNAKASVILLKSMCENGCKESNMKTRLQLGEALVNEPADS